MSDAGYDEFADESLNLTGCSSCHDDNIGGKNLYFLLLVVLKVVFIKKRFT